MIVKGVRKAMPNKSWPFIDGVSVPMVTVENAQDISLVLEPMGMSALIANLDAAEPVTAMKLVCYPTDSRFSDTLYFDIYDETTSLIKFTGTNTSTSTTQLTTLPYYMWYTNKTAPFTTKQVLSSQH